MEGQKKILEGIKVVELSNFVAIPVTGRMMAEMGAEVIKVEPEGGEIWRNYADVSFGVPANEQENPVFDIYNAYKKSVCINLKTKEGVELMHKLISQADVFITNNREDALKRNQLDWETLHKMYPKLIYTNMNGFGELGPESGRPGFDMTCFWVSTGFARDLMIDGDGSYPMFPPYSVGDVATGELLFAGVITALYNRERTGQGDRVFTSLYGHAIWCMSTMNVLAQDRFGYKYPRKRYECVPFAVQYRTKDNEWLLMTVMDYYRYYPRVFHALGLDELIEDPRYTTREAYYIPENRAYLIKRFEESFATKTAEEWKQIMKELDVPMDVLSHFRDIPKGEQALVNRNMEEINFTNGDSCFVPRPSLRFDSQEIRDLEPAPLLGSDTVEMMKRVGYSDEEIQKYADEKIVKICDHKSSYAGAKK